MGDKKDKKDKKLKKDKKTKKDKEEKKEKKIKLLEKPKKDKTDKKEKNKSEKGKVKVRICKKCCGFDVKKLDGILEKDEYKVCCIGKCVKKKPELRGKVYGYIANKFTVCDTKEEFFAKIKELD